MEANKILDADILDILFEGKNKDYGAYALRKDYNRRLIKSLIGTALVIVTLLSSYFLASLKHETKIAAAHVQDIQLESVKEEHKEIPPPVVKTQPPKVEIAKFTPPKIVKNDEVKPNEIPPDQDKLEDTKIGTINQEGVKDDNITAPPVSDGGKGVVEAPKQVEDDNHIWTSVEIESSYPGGIGAWARFLNKNLRYPEEAQNNEIQGSVLVQFVVDVEGNVSDVQIVSGPENGGLRDEAIRVIKKSGKWTPAIQNGRKVKSYKRQPIGFKIGDNQ